MRRAWQALNARTNGGHVRSRSLSSIPIFNGKGKGKDTHELRAVLAVKSAQGASSSAYCIDIHILCSTLGSDSIPSMVPQTDRFHIPIHGLWISLLCFSPASTGFSRKFERKQPRHVVTKYGKHVPRTKSVLHGSHLGRTEN